MRQTWRWFGPKDLAKIDDMELPRSAGVVLVILTDGLENQSREHTSASIRRLLDDRQDRQGWMVVYLGTNQNAILEGAKFGTRVSNTMTYSVDNIGVAMAATSRSTSLYASGSTAKGAAFTEEERERALKPGL